MKERLLWYDNPGYGYYPVSPGNTYDMNYFEKYEGYAKTERGIAITKARIDLVNRHVGQAHVLDIGIGSGHFISMRGEPITSGYDVNPTAIRWLLERELWMDPYFKDPGNATCFDSLEHMSRPDHFLAHVQEFLFVSIPIFRDHAHALASKHFRPDEHYWYFTRDGFVRWMGDLGFRLVEENQMETELGREEIGTFVFRRC